MSARHHGIEVRAEGNRQDSSGHGCPVHDLRLSGRIACGKSPVGARFKHVTAVPYFPGARKLCFFLLIVLPTAEWLRGEVSVEVLFKPPLPREFQAQQELIHSHVTTAVHDWVSRFQTSDCTITVKFHIKSWPSRGTGRSFVSAPYNDEKHDGKYVSEEGAAHEIRTGKDPNGDKPDIEMFFDPAYFRLLWFDPEPTARTAPIPRDELDAYSVILHELGHAFGFNGFRHEKTGKVRGEWMSAYDRWVQFDGKNFFFHGPKAVELYGRPIPLARTLNNYHHVAEKGATSDRELTEDLMNGITLKWAHRYYISPLDVAILGDCGLTPKE